MVIQVVVGWWTGSLALLADAAHLFVDAAGVGLSLLAVRFAERPATPEKTYGYYRVEILAALVNGVVLCVLALVILFEAWERLRRPHEVLAGPVLVVAVAALGVRRVPALHVSTLTSGREAMSAHVVVEPGTPADRILDELHVILHARFGIDHTTLQIETEAPSLLQISPRS